MDSDTIQRVFLSDDSNIAFFQCPNCNVTKEADVTKYKKITTAVTLKVKCTCGHKYSVMLERRKFFRKDTNLLGKFWFSPLEGPSQRGMMTVLDISKGGFKLKIATRALFKPGDILELEFNLDNKTQTLIKKQVFVRNVKGNIVNVEFCSFDSDEGGDRAIAFYLF